MPPRSASTATARGSSSTTAPSSRSGRINRSPQLRVDRRGAAAAVVDGDDGLGHHAAYRAMAEAVALAREAGIGAVGVVRSSHFGAAGAYARAGGEAGMVAFATTNADRLVALHGGAAPFHGTNPLAFAAPSGGSGRGSSTWRPRRSPSTASFSTARSA